MFITSFAIEAGTVPRAVNFAVAEYSRFQRGSVVSAFGAHRIDLAFLFHQKNVRIPNFKHF